MYITFIAPPAAGKGTFSKMVSAKYNIPHISTGDLLRNTNDENIKKKLSDGQFISDEIITELLFNRLNENDVKKGYVLDGFPRNLSQAKIYDTYLENQGKKQIVIILDLPKELAAKRIIGRKTCPQCGAVYNDMFDNLKPKQNDICDKCQNHLIHRTDDNKETFEKRYQTYLKETYPLVKHYEEKSLAYHVKADTEANETFKEIESFIGVLNGIN